MALLHLWAAQSFTFLQGFPAVLGMNLDKDLVQNSRTQDTSGGVSQQ